MEGNNGNFLEKKHRKRFYETIEQIIKSNQGKKIRKQFKSKIKIERTKREKSKILVKLPKHLRSSKALKDILTHKFCTQKKQKVRKHKSPKPKVVMVNKIRKLRLHRHHHHHHKRPVHHHHHKRVHHHKKSTSS